MKARTFGLLSLMLVVAMVMPCKAWVTLGEVQAGGAGSTLLSEGAAYAARMDDTGKNREVHVRQRIEQSACVDFEDLPLPPLGVYHVGDAFPTGPAIVMAGPFQWSGGGWTDGGYAQVDTAGFAGGSGQELAVNNINLQFHFDTPVSCLELKFGEYGGNLNIEINGDFRNFENFADINGLIIGGVQASVVNGLGNDQGTLTLNGTINSFVLGGQELWIDDVCVCPLDPRPCADFDDLPLPPLGEYHVGDTFATGPAMVTALPFQWSGGGWTSDGYAAVQLGGLAGGSGQEMAVNNINLHFQFGGTLPCLTLKFGEYGGNLNIEINGDFRNFENFADINGLIIGGVQASVVNGLGNDQGTLALNGTINSFVLGGQELWIDDVCPCRFVVYLPLVVRNTAAVMSK